MSSNYIAPMTPPMPTLSPEFIIIAGRSGLIGAFVSVFLSGMAILQTYNYFNDYPTDSVHTKVLVWVVTLLNLLHAILACVQTYHYLVGFNGIDLLDQIELHWSTMTAFGLHVAIAIIVLFYFTRISYRLCSDNKTQKPACAFLVAVILAHFATTIVDIITAENLTVFTSMATTQLSADIFVSLALCLALPTSGYKRTRSIVQKLVIYTVSRGILTSVAALIELIAVVISSHGLWFVAAELVTPGLYANSFLSSLNTRKHIRSQLAGTILSAPPAPIPLGTLKPRADSFMHQASWDDRSTQAASSTAQVSVYTSQKHADCQQQASNKFTASDCPSRG
ncbi:hypothetical protein BC629DRAFT_1594996 [Irpex lacteus]|nr:hypothetical protein BC629DRAFT_1594996 [Irpex lacteus]